MKKKVTSASLYLVAALAMGVYYDAVYGAGSVTHHRLLLRVGAAGAFLFGCTSLLSLWKPHRAVFVGVLACCLCWSDFGRIVPQIPFPQVFAIIGYAYWNETLLALLILILASAYSLRQTWRTFVSVRRTSYLGADAASGVYALKNSRSYSKASKEPR